MKSLMLATLLGLGAMFSATDAQADHGRGYSRGWSSYRGPGFSSYSRYSHHGYGYGGYRPSYHVHHHGYYAPRYYGGGYGGGCGYGGYGYGSGVYYRSGGLQFGYGW